MDNIEVHEAISKRDPLFYWMHLVNGKQYLIPFICQRCGNCCRVVSKIPCRHFKEPNICLIYDRRPCECQGFPVYAGIGAIIADCQGYKLSRKAMDWLGQGIGYDFSYWISYWSGYIFEKPGKLQKAITRLEKGNLPKGFIEKFVELNS